MCCFSGKVKHVSSTSIFCRMGARGNQVVIYSLYLEAEEDLAMVLPVPVTADRNENSVSFINLSLYPDFFPKLDRAFPVPRPKPASRSDPFGAVPGAAAPLTVQSVGSFEASFVPRMEDFLRLDERFRIAPEIWRDLPEFADHGFVVFKLKAGAAKVHPMAFAYPARDRTKITFPTVHIHDGTVHHLADFDHALYCQSESPEVRMEWQESVALAGGYVNATILHGSVLTDRHVYKRTMKGRLKNADVVVAAG
jgi:hypothetical protein